MASLQGTREAGKNLLDSLGGTREAPGRQEKTYWTAWEAPGRHQEHEGGARERAFKGQPVLRAASRGVHRRICREPGRSPLKLH